MDKESLYQKFLEFTGLKRVEDICSISKKILDDQATNDKALMEVETKLRTYLYQYAPPQAQDFYMKSLSHEQIQDVFFLLAAGSQLTANQLNNPSVNTNQFFVTEEPTLQSVVQGYVPPYTNEYNNSIFVTIRGINQYCGSVANRNLATSGQRYTDVLKSCVRSLISGSAEEAYHAFQHNDHKLNAQLVAESKKVYGTEDWIGERAKRFNLAMRSDAAARKEFHDNDPFEQDSDRFKVGLTKQFEALAEKFMQQQKNMGIR